MAKPKKDGIYGPYKESPTKYRVITISEGERASSTYPTKKEARDAIAEIRESWEQATGLTVGELREAYQRHQRVIEGNVDSSMRIIEQHLRAWFAPDTPVCNVTPEIARKRYADFIEQPLRRTGKPPSAAYHQMVLDRHRWMWSWAIAAGKIKGSSPWKDVKPAGKKKKGKAQLTIDEARKLIDVCLAERSPAAIAVLALIYLGLSASEICDRLVRDIDGGGWYLWIPHGKTDNRRRMIEIPAAELAELLAELAAGRPSLDRLMPGTRQWLWRHVQRLCDLAGVPRVSAHSFRGMHADIAAARGVAAKVVAAELGQGGARVAEEHYIKPGTIAAADRRKVLGILQGGRS